MTRAGPAASGLLVLDKPAGPTSHDVVDRVRRIFGQRRVGHAGTLDPPATGVLLVGLGRATRLLRFLSALPKRYTCEVVLGVATSTLDDTGEVAGTWDMVQVTDAEVDAAARSLCGEIWQVPPMVSAVKVGGRRLHELARAGAEVERDPRRVQVHALEVARGAEPGVWSMDVTCSAGTYVRVLAADLGAALGGGAHLRSLRRRAVGDFTLEQAATLEEVAAEPAGALRDPREAVGHLPALEVGPETAEAVLRGAVLDTAVLGGEGGAGPWAVLDGSGRLLAVYESHWEGALKPAVVLAP